MAAPPTPVPRVSRTTLEPPLAAPFQTSANKAAWASFHTGTEAGDSSHCCQFRFSNPGRRLGNELMQRLSGEAKPGAATPTHTGVEDRRLKLRTTSRARSSHALVPSSFVGVVSSP